TRRRCRLNGSIPIPGIAWCASPKNQAAPVSTSTRTLTRPMVRSSSSPRRVSVLVEVETGAAWFFGEAHHAGSSSLYFHQNAYSSDGQKLIITTPSGLSAINLKTREIEKIVESRSVIVTGRKTG